MRALALALLALLPLEAGAQFKLRAVQGGGAAYTPPVAFQETTAARTYYVATTGSDSNACIAAEAPCLTIQGALDKVPKVLRHATVIQVGPGTFDAAIVEGFRARQAGGDSTRSVHLELAGSWSAITPATGSATGTVASFVAASGATPASITVTSAGWTTNNLRGAVLWPTAGAGLGRALLVASNTSDTITFAGTAPTLDGTTTFELRQPSTTVTCNLTLPNSYLLPHASYQAGTGLTGWGCLLLRDLRGGATTTLYDHSSYRVGGFSFSGGTSAVQMHDARGVLLSLNRFSGQTGTSSTYAQVLVAGSEQNRVLQNYSSAIADQAFIGTGSSSLSSAARGLEVSSNVVVGGALIHASLASVESAHIARNWSFDGNHSSGIITMEGAFSFAVISLNRVAGNASSGAACVRFGSGVSIGSSLGGNVRFEYGDYSGCNWGIYATGPNLDITASFGAVTGTGNTRFGLVAINGVTVRASNFSVTGTLGDASLDDSTAITWATAQSAIQVDSSYFSHLRPSP